MQEVNFENLNNCLDFFKKESLASSSKEIVGFLGLKDNKPFAKIVKNRAQNPQEHFLVDPLEMRSFKNDYELIAVFHSHVFGDSEFSDWDKKTADNCLFPFIVYSIQEDKFGLYVPNDTDVSSVNIEALRKIIG